MKTFLRNCLLLSVNILFLACSKNTNAEKERFTGQNNTTESENNNIIEEIALSFINKKSITNYRRSTGSDVSSLDSINLAQGYYIQQASKLDNHSRSPEILALSVEDGKVFIREIDFTNQQKINRNEIQLNFDGETYAHNNTKLETQNGEIQIIYLEHRPKMYWDEIWDYDTPYTFAGDLNSNVPDNVRILTTDYLITFIGQYIFDSYKIIDQINTYVDIGNLESSTIRIEYNDKKKCLSFRCNLDNFRNRQIDFVETTEEKPFYWSLGESAGYTESIFYFYKNGIAFTYAQVRYTPDEAKEQILKYVVFFRKRKY